ncbi:MAG: permease [Candidatus Eremiobacteraeota bacterium]|nr:permease [Candidatus Eremiobacteraeota bacterium]
MPVVTFIGHWLFASFAMFWQVLWSLLAGFLASAMIQAYVPKGGLSHLFGRAGLRELAIATGFGAASSSCSYASAATAKSLFKRGADFTVAMVFMFASTNLVVELGLVLWQLMGWQFVLAEWVGGLVLITVFVLLARIFLRPQFVEPARMHEEPAEGGHSHDHDDMLAPGRTLAEKLRSPIGWRYVAHYFEMDWSMLRMDLALGFLIGGLLAVAVPAGWWQHLYLAAAPGLLRDVENALVGPLVAIISFVCSIGNVPLAAVLWQGGSTFGGVIAFLYADLIVIPLIDVYRKYYGWRVAIRMVVVFYATMVVSGLIVQWLFRLFHAIPQPHGDFLMQIETLRFNATTILNIVFVGLTALLVWWGNRSGAESAHV